MRYIFISLFLFPTFMLAQNVGIGTTNPTEKLEVNGIIFTSQGGIKFPDGSIQTTAAPTAPAARTTSSERSANLISTNFLSGLVIEFHPSAGLEGPITEPGFETGINIHDVFVDFETTSTIIGSQISTSLPSFSNVSFSRRSDELSATIPFLVASNSIIPYIRVFHLRLTGGGPLVDKITVYENCILDGYSSSSTANNLTGEIYHYSNEIVSFFFTKACFRDFRYDEFDTLLGHDDSCWDRVTQTGAPGDPACSCSF